MIPKSVVDSPNLGDGTGRGKFRVSLNGLAGLFSVPFGFRFWTVLDGTDKLKAFSPVT
jgi:hypothetical protein